MLEVRHLRLIRAVVEEGGPTRAAARLHLTQSAVSHQLRELEARLGVSLFTRVHRKLVLTTAGRRLVTLSDTLLTEIARAESELYRAEKRVRLSIVVETFTSYHWLPRLLVALQRDYPQVELQVALDATEKPLPALLRGAVDLALMSSPVRDKQLAVNKLFEDEWVTILPPSHPLARKRFVSASDLGGQTLYAHKTPQRDIERLRDRIAAERTKMPKVQIVPLTETLVELVKAGLGIGLMSRWAVAPHESGAQIVARRFTREGMREQWSLVHRRDAGEPQLMDRIVRLLQSESSPATRT
jgi:LysR family transcriptional regulator for metE and metH